MLRKLVKVFLSFVVMFCTLTMVSVDAGAAEKEYEIYPKPHSITYQDGNYVMRGKVNVVYDETIDIATKNHLTKILKSKGKDISVSNSKDESKTNIFVGTYNSGGKAAEYAKANYSLNADTFSQFSGHQVISNNGEIVVIGKDTDAAFYGITSLKLIFNQIDGSALRNFTIKDYADTNIRGFIEGYYGIPWSNEDRMSLMKFGGDFKMTAYVFAPKNDLYHTSKWRELYPEAELNAIKEMVQVGIDTKCKFVWTAHPFMGGFNANKKDEEIALLLKKFDQLYSAGVRQFGVLGDDVGSLDRAVVIDIMKAVSDWGKAKGDVFDPLFCPAGYNDSWQGNYSELNDYDKGFPKEVQIFWTGEAVCQPVEQKTLTNFKTKNLAEGQAARRNPLFWLNWPVNDINGSRLMMGKGSLLQTDINVNDLSGVVTNPMQEAEASKVALFAVADYSWNVKGFDDDQSWADSFKYIDEDAGEDLHTLAKHMSNPQPNGHGLVLAESEELKPLIDTFKTKLSSKQSIIESGSQLIKEMDIIIQACDGFNANTKNDKLKKELEPFMGSLKDLANAIKSYIGAAIALENNEKNTAFNAYTQATASFKSSKNHVRNMLNGTAKVSPGSTHLIPLAEAVEKAISADISEIASGGESKLVLTASSSFSGFQGNDKIENIIDGLLTTTAWHNGYEAAGQYYQVNLSQPTTIYGVNITNGTNDKPQDTFGYAKVKYSTDNGQNWKDMNGTEYGEYQTVVNINGVSIDNVTNVRYECTRTGSGNKWPAMREFEVLTENVTAPTFTSTVIRTTEGWSVHSGAESNLIDGDDNTSVHYRVRQGGTPGDSTIAGDYVGVKLSQSITLGKIHILQGVDDGTNDYFKNVDLEYSTDGTTWTKVGTYSNQKAIDIDLSDQNITAQYVRLKNNAEQKNWIGFREFKVDAKVFFNSTAYTNVDAYKSVKANCLEDQGILNPTDNVTLANNEYIGLKMKRIHQLKTITTDLSQTGLTLQISDNGIEWKNVIAGDVSNSTGRYIRLINLTGTSITLDIRTFTVLTDEIQQKSLASTSGFSIGGDRLNVFDGDRTSQTVYTGSQNSGKYFTYDLGQTIDLKSFKVVCRDSEQDYPRHGKFSVSEDGANWNDILTLGNQTGNNEGEAENTDNINDVLPVHEISYNTKEATGLNLKARYLKFELTRTKVGADKWVRFQEFELNGGEYIPVENNPTFESTSKETANGLFSYMTDGDLSTMFIPTDKTGSLTYKVSDKNDSINTIKIIQNSTAISKAVVKARIIRNTTRASDEWVNLGTLSQAINEFNIPSNAKLLDVKIEWNNTDLNITEFMLFNAATTVADKSILQGKVDNQENISTWTTQTAKNYQDSIDLARKVLGEDGIAQSSIDNVVEVINRAVTNKKIKGDVTELKRVIDNAYTDATKYTASTWKAYTKSLDIAKALVNQKDNYSQTEIDACLTNLQTVQTGLIFNPTNRELAIIGSEDIHAFINAIIKPENLYTLNSFELLNKAIEELDDLIEEDKTSVQDPDKFLEATEKVENAKTNLISVKTLPALIEEFDTINADIYTVSSYNAYKDAVNNAKELLVNGTSVTIDEVIAKIALAKTNLQLKVYDKETLKSYIKELQMLSKDNYTQKSYQNLEVNIERISSKIDTASNVEVESYTKELKDSKNALVSIVSLKEKVSQAKALDAKLYTISSYHVLKTEIEKAEKLYIDGTQKGVSDSELTLENAIRSLKVRVNEAEARKYIESLKMVNGNAYTKESYDKYIKAFSNLKNMLNRLNDVSGIEYTQAKEAYDRAYQGLALNNKIQTNDSTTINLFVVLGLIAIGAVFILRKKEQ